jgi:hypothetical protein
MQINRGESVESRSAIEFCCLVPSSKRSMQMHRYAIIVAAVAALLIAPGCDSSGSSNGDNSGSKGQATEEIGRASCRERVYSGV